MRGAFIVLVLMFTLGWARSTLIEPVPADEMSPQEQVLDGAATHARQQTSENAASALNPGRYSLRAVDHIHFALEHPVDYSKIMLEVKSQKLNECSSLDFRACGAFAVDLIVEWG